MLAPSKLSSSSSGSDLLDGHKHCSLYSHSLSESPDQSDSGTESDSTLEDVESCAETFGHPLQRMEPSHLAVTVNNHVSAQAGIFGLGKQAEANVQHFIGSVASPELGPGLYSLRGRAYASPSRSSSTSLASATSSASFGHEMCVYFAVRVPIESHGGPPSQRL